MDSCCFLTVDIRFCLMVDSSTSLGPRLQTRAGTAATPPTAPETGVGISTSTSWVQRNPLSQIITVFTNKCCWYFKFSLVFFYHFLAVSPTIVGLIPEGFTEEVTVTLSNPTSLVCEVQSYPPAIITWLKDGTVFESRRNIRVLPGLIL